MDDEDGSDGSQDSFKNITVVKKEATLDSLPEKSRHRYEHQYANFMEWILNNKINHISENTVLAYFVEKSETLMPSTLWSLYSMLRSTLAINDNIHIKKFTKLILFLKKKSVGFHPKMSKTLTLSKSEIDKFLLEAPNDTFLMVKVALIIGVAGGCRCDELCKLSIQDIQDKDSILIVTLPDYTKKREQRMFTISDGITQNLHLYRTYVSLRPAKITHNRLFLTYRRKKCTVQPVGVNTISKVPGLIAKYLNLGDSNLYTGHCFRRTWCTLLRSKGGDFFGSSCSERRSTSVPKRFPADKVMEQKRTILPSPRVCNNHYDAQSFQHTAGFTNVRRLLKDAVLFVNNFDDANKKMQTNNDICIKSEMQPCEEIVIKVEESDEESENFIWNEEDSCVLQEETCIKSEEVSQEVVIKQEKVDEKEGLLSNNTPDVIDSSTNNTERCRFKSGFQAINITREDFVTEDSWKKFLLYRVTNSRRNNRFRKLNKALIGLPKNLKRQFKKAMQDQSTSNVKKPRGKGISDDIQFE